MNATNEPKPAREPKQGSPSPEEQLQLLSAADEPHSSHIIARLRGYFLTGLIVVGPVAITIYVFWWFINLVDGWVKPLLPEAYLPDNYLPFPIPGVGLIVGIIALIFVGALTANLFGRTIVSYGEMMLDRMPVVRGVYRLLKQIFQTVFSKSGTSFKRVGLIEFPRRGLYTLVFISGEPPAEVKNKVGNGELWMTVFLPNAPNPTTGFVIFIPASEVTMLDMAIEDGVKMVVSAGLVSPDQAREDLHHLAKAKAKANVKTKGKTKGKKPVPEEEPVV